MTMPLASGAGGTSRTAYVGIDYYDDHPQHLLGHTLRLFTSGGLGEPPGPTSKEAWTSLLGMRGRALFFVEPETDLYREGLHDLQILDVLQFMCRARWHVFVVITRRCDRAAQFMRRIGLSDGLLHLASDELPPKRRFVVPNVWFAASVQDQRTADERLQQLRATPAAVRAVYAAPLLGRLSLADRLWATDWVIAAGEVGKGDALSRPMAELWPRILRDQCAAKNVPFFFMHRGGRKPFTFPRDLDGQTWEQLPRRELVPIPSKAERRELRRWAERTYLAMHDHGHPSALQ